MLPPAFSMHPTTMKTPVSLATFSSSSLVPSPLASSPSPSRLFFPAPPISLLTHASPAPPPPSPTMSPKSTALLKYARYSSRPAAERFPMAQPKVAPRG